MFDLISIGDAVIDTFVPLDEAEIMISPKDGESRLCLRYGGKIPTGPFEMLVAGNAANNAVGASRLKMKVAIYTNVGFDVNGEKIKEVLKAEGVNVRYVIQNKEYPTNHHIVLDYDTDRTILVYHQPWKYVLPDIEKTKWIYLTSLSPSYTETDIVMQIVHYLERTGAKMLYNPGTFQIKQGVKKNPRLLLLTEVFIVNKEEAGLILGVERRTKVSIKRLLKGIHDLGPKQVIITDGSRGSYGFDGERYYQIGLFPAKLVEMTGSGDAYATGCLAAYFYGYNLSEAMRWGAANSASVVERVGAQAGLLSYDEINRRLKETKVFAKEF